MQQCQYEQELPAVVGYVRVSTTRQGRSGLGLAAQKTCIEAFAKREGLTLLQIYEEVQSGRDDDRPVLKAAMEYAKSQGAMIAVARIDRLSRRVSFISSLMEKGSCAFVTCELGMNTENFMLHIWSSLAEKRADEISKRTKAALQAKIAGGWQAGNPELSKVSALGRQKQMKKADEFALKVAPVVRAFQADGVSTKNGLALHLNEAGIQTARGAKWYAATIGNLLARLERLEAERAG